MKVIINKCYGGFGLSREAMQYIAKARGIKLYIEENEKFPSLSPTYWIVPKEKRPKEIKNWAEAPIEDRQAYNEAYSEATLECGRDVVRHDKDLVAAVHALGEKADGFCSELKVVEIPDGTDYVICEYDGLEHIAEKHQTWR